eukprot:TRINITY_DN1248_c0_g1_i1.p1 TRINITY_DN1248_c0_g1~~TRINITY_DN1248_c0_g1_i1.p1  ORF type:complete len:200 (-),score=66.46 TRINITY_DN1248_c0_g1_i1:507-1106(-)
MSRQQRRKAAKAAAEKERMKEYAKIAKEAGPDPGLVELQKLKEKLNPLGLKVKSVPADGNCLFAAVANQLNLRQGKNVRHKDIRQQTMTYMKNHPDQYASFITEDFDDYCERMQSQPLWGGHVELMAMAEMLDTAIEVYQAEDEPLIMGGEHEEDDEAQPLTISYHRHLISTGEHYNSVVPKEEGDADDDEELDSTSLH